MDKLTQHIFLIGFMGAGKSTIAAKLQEMLDVKQMEMDQIIVEQQKMPITEIFEKYGEAHFRDIESQLLIDLKNEAPGIVSCGGGIVVREENPGYMKESGKIVFLTATPETIYERVKDSTERPILNGNMNVEYIRELMEKRRAKYEAAADIIVATDGKSAEEICSEILAQM
ncbi:MAG: shikimate kinase [Lachnospiraceae bacterium]|nr:shikimate kinase [Lachnospiraceae bacterium]